MKNSMLHRRLARLEAKSQIDAELSSLVIIARFLKLNGQFGGEPCESDRAEADGQVWRREPGETSKDFEDRVIADLPTREHCATQVIFHPAE